MKALQGAGIKFSWSSLCDIIELRCIKNIKMYGIIFILLSKNLMNKSILLLNVKNCCIISTSFSSKFCC